jgi:hypothetical protein
MVTTNEGAPSSSDPGSESGTALSKLRQTLSSSLMTAQDKGKSYLTLSVAGISKSLVAGMSLRKFAFPLMPVYVEFIVSKVVLGQIILPSILGFLCQYLS